MTTAEQLREIMDELANNGFEQQITDKALNRVIMRVTGSGMNSYWEQVKRSLEGIGMIRKKPGSKEDIWEIEPYENESQ